VRHRVKDVDVQNLIVKKNIVIAIIEALNVDSFVTAKIVRIALLMRRCQTRFD